MTNGGRYKPRKVLTLTCWACSDKFKATRPDARYCGPTCRKQESRATISMKRLKKILVSTNAPQAGAKLAGKK